MGQIYSDATVTISAMASRGSTQGILQCSTPNLSPVCTLLPLYSHDTASESVSLGRLDLSEEDLRILTIHGPLSSRSWTFQEMLLSRRHLFYGEHQIYWKCTAGYEAANGVAFGPKSPSINSEVESSLNSFGAPPSCSMQTVSSSDAMLLQYYDLINDYSRRRLTFNKDKLPAISGIVQRLHPRIGGDYLAGLWSNDIVRGLAWWKEGRSAKHVEQYRAPSW